MLVKWLCVKCYDEHRVVPWADRRNIKKKERTWSRGRMCCVAILDIEHKTRFLKTDGDPPKCCFYLLEQTLHQSDG
jgi:hypothetical protein